MEEKTLIYVAGNPDAYPLEYFDKDTQTYAGVIPELLAEFSDQSTYEIVYYEADGTDHREELAQQKQVDLFSGYEAEEEQLENTGVVTLFPGENAYTLYFTEAAPDAFQSNLRAYLEQVSPAAQYPGDVLDNGRHGGCPFGHGGGAAADGASIPQETERKPAECGNRRNHRTGEYGISGTVL